LRPRTSLHCKVWRNRTKEAEGISSRAIHITWRDVINITKEAEKIENILFLLLLRERHDLVPFDWQSATTALPRRLAAGNSCTASPTADNATPQLISVRPVSSLHHTLQTLACLHPVSTLRLFCGLIIVRVIVYYQDLTYGPMSPTRNDKWRAISFST
jgi:hypothetical protein